MRTAFHASSTGSRVVGDMCGLAGEAMARATQALLQADLVLAEQVITDQTSGADEGGGGGIGIRALGASVTGCR